MKHSLSLLSLLPLFAGLILGRAQNQDPSQILVQIGFPQCSVSCIQEGTKAAIGAGCTQQDAGCTCPGGKGEQASNAAVQKCLTETAPCGDDDLPKIKPAGDAFCARMKSGGAGGGAAKTSGAAKPSGARTSGAAAAASSSKAAANPQRTFGAGIIGFAGAAAAAFAL